MHKIFALYLQCRNNFISIDVQMIYYGNWSKANIYSRGTESNPKNLNKSFYLLCQLLFIYLFIYFCFDQQMRRIYLISFVVLIFSNIKYTCTFSFFSKSQWSNLSLSCTWLSDNFYSYYYFCIQTWFEHIFFYSFLSCRHVWMSVFMHLIISWIDIWNAHYIMFNVCD